jgi:hypothetical protein
MGNFNLRYECNDARDDFAAQRRTSTVTGNDWPFDINNNILDDVEDNFNSMLFSDDVIL